MYVPATKADPRELNPGERVDVVERWNEKRGEWHVHEVPSLSHGNTSPKPETRNLNPETLNLPFQCQPTPNCRRQLSRRLVSMFCLDGVLRSEPYARVSVGIRKNV